jgi:tRNA nucleotidyltransferase (CCA-adding enzyme)
MKTEELIANKIAAAIEESGGDTFYVGGYVRDKIRNPGMMSKDVDLEVFGINAQDLQQTLKVFGSVSLVGESFGILKVTVNGVTLDVGLPRKDFCTGRGHRTFLVDTDSNMSPEEASNRRDLTVNAIMQNVLSGEILDFHNGVSDLKNHIIRAVDEQRFMEDSLRLLRAPVYAAILGKFVIEKNTFNLISKHAASIKNEKKFRIFDEISKLLMRAETPSYGFELMNELGLLELILPEIWVLQGVTQRKIYHPEGNVFDHTMRMIDYEPNDDRDLVMQLTYLYHDVGKVYGSPMHDLRSSEIVEETLPIRLTEDKSIISEVSNLSRHHMSIYGGDITPARVKRLAAKSDVQRLCRLYVCDKFSRGLSSEVLMEDTKHLEKFLTIYNDVKNEVAPIVLGRHIQEYHPEIKPGPIYSTILSQVYEAQLDDKFNDLASGLQFMESAIKSLDVV